MIHTRWTVKSLTIPGGKKVAFRILICCARKMTRFILQTADAHQGSSYNIQIDGTLFVQRTLLFRAELH